MFGDYNEAEAILKKAYGIVCSDEKLEKECPLGEILKKLGEVEEMLEKPAEAVQYYEKLKEYQNAGGSVEMDATDLDDKLTRLSGLS